MQSQVDPVAHAVASALRPGVVIGEYADGVDNYVADLDMVARGEIAGYNSRVVGGCRQLFPRLSKLDYEAIKLMDLEEVPGALEDIVSTVPGLSDAAKGNYLSSRKLVRQDMPDGGARLIMVPRAPRAMTEAEIKDHENFAEDEGEGVSQVGVGVALADREKKRTYSLAQILSDGDVLQKYDLGLRAVETAKRVAATDPVAAASMFQSMMNSVQSEVAVRVTSGDYSRNRVQAKNAIRQMCSSAVRTDAAVESIVSMDVIFMYGPQGIDDWHVMGPLKYASEVSYVYWLVRSQGCINPSILLAMELVLLRIEIYDGFTCQMPELEYHASPGGADLQVGLRSEAAAVMSTESRLAFQGLSDKLLPVIASDGAQIATAVRVTGKYVLVNSHVVATDRECTIGGAPVIVKSQLSRDLWCAKSDGEAPPWLLRSPRLGETVIVCYTHEGKLGCSRPLQVTSVDGETLVTTLDDSVTFGMSGGAIVAVDDMALLGVHSAATLNNLLAYRFGERELGDLLESDSVTSFSRHGDVGSFAAKTVEHFKKRGLSSFMSRAIDSMEPVFVDNKHVGMIVRSGDHMYTTCDAEQPLRIGLEFRVASFDAVGPHCYRTSSVVYASAPAYRRKPNHYEKVFILGCDTEPYISVETSVLHVGPNGRSFVIADLPALDKPVQGGLVMAWDGAILGCCGSRSYSTAVGLGYTCWPLPVEEKVSVVNPRAVLERSFSFLNMPAWPDALVEEVFTHTSVGKYTDANRTFNAGPRPLANIGDNIAKAELFKTLREYEVPHSTWSGIMQSLQSNAHFARIAWAHNLAQAMRVGSGTSVPKESKAYADLTEAVIGAASLIEKPETVSLLCKSLGIVYQVNRPRLERTPSETMESSVQSLRMSEN